MIEIEEFEIILFGIQKLSQLRGFTSKVRKTESKTPLERKNLS